MTKQEAQAILTAQKRIRVVLSACRSKLTTPDEQVYFDNYWGAHIEAIMDNRGYGSAPIARAESLFEGSE